jgi:ADP-heptose:LPS heptosyltransferase
VKPKLLVLELWGIGDLAIATPFLRAAIEKFEVTLLAKPHARELQPRFWPETKLMPLVAPWTAFRGKYRLHVWPWRELLRVRRALVKERFEIGTSGRWDPRDHLLLALSRARRRIGFPRTGSAIFLTGLLERPPREAHRYENWRAVGKALGLDVPARETMPVPQPRRGFVLVHTGAAQAVRVWPLERFRGLVHRLRERGFVVQVACDANQREWWLAAGEANVAATRTLPELFQQIDAAGVFVGCDSGPGHLAALCGVPTFTLFGPQVPEWFVPLHPQSEWVNGPVCPYRPCWDYCRFPAPNCMIELQAAVVWERVEAFVARHAEHLEATRF